MAANSGLLRGTPDAYIHENGRTYHGYRAGAYMYPNDEKEKDKMDVFHRLCEIARGEVLHHAPIAYGDRRPPEMGQARILDLGCGTGIWAIDMADRYQQAEVIGVDLSMIQPKWIPQNLRFHCADYESEWTLGQNSFDFIHLRHAVGSVSNYLALFRKVLDHLIPGYGYFEYVDVDIDTRADDHSLANAPNLLKWQQMMFEATASTGKPIQYDRDIHKYLKDAGFVNIQEQVIQIPLNPWPEDPQGKEISRWYQLMMITGIEGMTLGPLHRVYRWPKEDIIRLTAEVMREMRSRDIRGYHSLHIWTAQRPPYSPPRPSPPRRSPN